ncbi:CDGSH iron-sulfur domain-containing protein 3, mitochondrial [Daktulosphaira vitifoliae]|uniref:CDGSH iron-sulfur domain-containing protein 3, mitochondrial n=1 Tax=Daktulosphaira vitifoliae TaxID=58002 RepID=UPI0021A9C848|nr:CDGSH iron-sulfur domain-containing protein 3, mitochondrial [Daktulosphaira vitifoliae]
MLFNLSKSSQKLNFFFNFRTYSKIINDILPKNVLEDYHTASKQAQLGNIYDKRPFKITLDKDKTYNWCSCGMSHSQPFCDGTHKNQKLKITMKPVKLQVTETKEYWLCNCKQTKHRPFCDGSHKQLHVQEAIKKY